MWFDRINNYTICIHIVLLGIFFAFSVQTCLGQEKTKPNIIFILADDLGYGDIEPFGQDKIKTPNLRRMVREGIKFTNHYAGNTVCAPSRASLMTGMHPGSAPIRGNKRDNEEGVIPLPYTTQTIAEMLKMHTDYKTGLYGRWHLGGIHSDAMPHQRGFDEFFGPLSKYHKSRNPRHRPDLYKNEDLLIIDENNNGDEGKYVEDLITDEALKFISKNNENENPFFLYMAYSLVHAPVEPAPGETLYDHKDWPKKEKNFAETVTHLDGYVGKIMDHLKKLGIAENTLVIFTSDNGPHLEDGHDPEFFNSNGPFKGYKRDLYEGGIRMPFIAWWPGKIKAGTTSDHISAFWDLMPTVADLAGIQSPDQTDGISYLPSLLGKEQPTHEYLYWEFITGKSKQAIRSDQWKAINYPDQHRFELYNLEKDPGETTNLAGKYPDKAYQLREKMKEAHTYNDNFPLLRSEKFVQVNEKDPRYFQYSDGSTYIPIGPNIPWSRITTDPDSTLALYDEYFKTLSENGGNFTRIWLSAPVWEVEHKRAHGYDFKKTEYLLDSLLRLASKYGIKIKFCFENFRQLLGRPAPFAGSVPFDKPIYHEKNGGPISSMDEYFKTEQGRELFLHKMEFFSNHYANNPSVFGWELWNEINSVQTSNKPEDILEWSRTMLDKAKRHFPHQLVMQSMGSFDRASIRNMYKKFSIMKGNELAQIHRYLDPGADLDVAKGPMDILASDATNELLSFDLNKPVLLSEVGAVEANHAGPSKLYDKDSEGVLLHDMIFAPFFSGAAGPGESWHWHHYIDKHDLWWHFSRFKEAIRGFDPVEEEAEPFYSETEQLRLYSLTGKQTVLAWCRDRTSNWKEELVKGNGADRLTDIEVSLSTLGIRKNPSRVSFYLPWKNKWIDGDIENGNVIFPDFVRSVVVKAEY